MLGKFEDFFVELAQVFKKHGATSPFGSRLSVSFVEDNRVVGMHKITEAWITKEGEAVLRVRNDDPGYVGHKQEYEIYSDGKLKLTRE